jgi:nucleoside-diphosphate-sugar epimerase
MTVLLTGASGFLGGRVAQLLDSRGASVRVLVRQGRDLRHLVGTRVEVIQGGLCDEESLARAVRGASHIIHCAGCSTDWAPWPVFFESNVTGVENLLRAAAGESRLERFLHVSTTDVYGYPNHPCDESHPLTDVNLPYNRSKCMGEQRVWDTARDIGLPVTVVRPATIYGPRGKAFVADIAKLIRQGSMAVIDGGRAPGGFCYVDNAANGIIDAAMHPLTQGQSYNLSDGTGVTWREYVDALADALGRRRPWINLPSSVAFALAGAFEATHRHLRLAGNPLLTRHGVLLLSRNQEYPIDKAQRDFGFAREISFPEGIARSATWVKEEWAAGHFA